MNEEVTVFWLLELSHISEGCVRKVGRIGGNFIAQTAGSRLVIKQISCSPTAVGPVCGGRIKRCCFLSFGVFHLGRTNIVVSLTYKKYLIKKCRKLKREKIFRVI